jgi:UDP-2,3-diacylglucosamine pyrophosphatase LpxH
MYDAIIISDLHLGSINAQVFLLRHFLESIRQGTIPTARLILNGDVFDSHDFRRLKKHHWKILSLLRSMSDEVPIIWLNGNHDGPAELISSLIGVQFADEYILESGLHRILVLHGHQFDTFIDKHPWITAAADWVYRGLQRLDPSFRMARSAKRASKTFLRCSEQIESRAKAHAAKRGCTAVCCGHTHLEMEKPGDISYFNSGSWTELPCGYLTVRDGIIAQHHFTTSDIECPAQDPLTPTPGTLTWTLEVPA